MLLNRSENLRPVHSDIRGPLYLESQRMAKEGTPVLRLNTGNPATFGFGLPDSVREALLANVDKAVAYCDLKGMPNAREAICEYHKSKGIQGITPDDVYIGNGVSELVLMCLLALLNKGDEVLMPSPSYSLWSNSTYIAGGRPVFYTCDEDNEWYPDIADMRSKVTPRTRAIVIINPNNPTGAVYPKEVLEDIIPVARENDLLIFSEECILKKTGLTDAETAVRQMWSQYHPKVCGATMGARGSMCFDGRDFVKCPAFPVEKVVDTTGCGDLFHTGFAVRWLETHDLLECQRFAAAVSAIKCRGLSGRPPAAPRRDEVESFLAARPNP